MEAVLVILVAFLAVIGIALCIAMPRYAIVPVLMLFPAEQILTGYIHALRFQYNWLVNVVVGMIAVAGVTYKFFRGERVFRESNNRIFLCVMALYTYICVSIIWSQAPESAFFYLGQGWTYFVLLYLVSPLLINSLEDLERTIPAAIFVGIVLMALMLVNPDAKFINDRFVIDLGYGVGIGEMRSNPLAIADAGGTLAIMAALYRPASANPAFKLMRWTGILLGLTLALLSGSRGQLLAGAGIIAVALPFVGGSRNALRMVGGIIFVGVMLGFLYFVFTNFVVGLGQDRWVNDSSGGIETRWGMAMAALSGYGSHPALWLVGTGAASFNAFYEFRSSSEHWYPHNIVIEAVTEYGLPGILLLCTILFITVRKCAQMMKNAKGDEARRSTVLVFGALILFQFLMGLKQGALLGIPPLFMYCLIIGRVAKHEETAMKQAALEQAELDTYEGSGDELTDDEAESGGWAPQPGHA